ncbi:pilus assembly protein N-terminal domain-containing protein [Bradyrhizobium sp. WYCCWR 13023]|uniref:Pilus assembly protein N-terminal domain-containing protein n=2 Tax=Nitrobacteraceae TaxID=41294 RepID=A0A9X1RKZ9_9BRAD|nr:pilus assembly protein N-terminal domain-containing protein [Bradyrhizobium zhengyangense]
MSGSTSSIELDRSFENILVGNADLIDVHRLGDRLVVVEALAAGSSNLIFVDRRSIAIANIRIIVSNSNAM